MSRKHQKKEYKKTAFSLLDIVVLTAGAVDIFERCIDSILSQNTNIESKLYIFNNALPEETLPKYQQIYEKCPSTMRLLKSKENMGFPVAVNRAIRAGTSPLVLFVSDDVILHQNCIDILVRRMDDPSIGLCGMKLLFPNDSTTPSHPAGKVQHVGHSMNIKGDIFHIFIGWSADHPKTNISRDAFSVTGAAFIVRRKLFLQVGGFFEGYGLGTYEDVDLCLTLRQLGYRIFIETNAVGTHYVGTTAIMKKRPFPIEYNKLIFQQRHMRGFAWDEWDKW